MQGRPTHVHAVAVAVIKQHHTGLLHAFAHSFPQRVQVPETDPVNPIYIAISDSAGKPVAAAVEASIKKLGEAKYPVTIIPQLNDIGGWGEAALSPLFVWLDTLDRI